MQDIRVVALDLDGTVFDDAKTISPRNAAARSSATWILCFTRFVRPAP